MVFDLSHYIFSYSVRCEVVNVGLLKYSKLIFGLKIFKKRFRFWVHRRWVQLKDLLRSTLQEDNYVRFIQVIQTLYNIVHSAVRDNIRVKLVLIR